MSKLFLSMNQVEGLARDLANMLANTYGAGNTLTAYCVPRGGVPAGFALARYLTGLVFVQTPDAAQIIIDDIIDSGSTRDRFDCKPFYALIDKQKDEDFQGKWVVFPWEKTEEKSIEDNIQRLLQFCGEDPTRNGLEETPARVAKAWKFWTSGYDEKAEDILKVFTDGAEQYNQMVTVKDIPVYSHCEHHLASIFGTATISYIPNGSIVGLSKLSRLVNMYARRLQVQERLTDNIADAIAEHLSPQGVGVVIKARHMCMESRGVCQQGHHTITTALRGLMLTDPTVRSEFQQGAL
jgi:GTP cyclohydrolase I